MNKYAARPGCQIDDQLVFKCARYVLPCQALYRVVSECVRKVNVKTLTIVTALLA